MFSALEACKLAMKDEATEHYRSLAAIFESKKQQLEKVEDELKEVSSSVIASVQDNDQRFMGKVDSIMTHIKNLSKMVETVPLKVTEPQLLTAQAVSTEVVVRYFKTLCSLHNLACPKMCKVEESILDHELFVDRRDTFTLILHDSADNPCNGGENNVEVDLVNLEGSSTKGTTEPISMNRVKLSFTPKRRGQHKLNIKVNGAHIVDSPFTVFVNMPPKHLSQPITSITGLNNPTGLIYSQGMVIATEKGRNRILKIDLQYRFKELIQLVDVTELTEDSNLNLYATTTMDHKVHKLSRSGKIIKTVGHYGKKNAEFNFPNGLKVSRNNELYVCDSGNNRIQVFDLNLKFKRSFGKKGSGKGQFDFPSDVTFDSNGCIYIADNGNSRIQVFASNDRHTLTISGQKESSIKFDPVRLLIHKDHIYITDYFNHYVIVMSLTGETVTKFGGEFLHEPEGITVDSNGFVYVTSHHSKIVVF
jgi:DNA-binding beta-propeller fold protein YncE